MAAAPTVSERTPEEEDLASDITMRYGPTWVLIAASAGPAGQDFNVTMAVGPALPLDVIRPLLLKTLEAM